MPHLRATDVFSRIKGRVILPDDPAYDDTRTVFYGGIDKRPAAIVLAANAEDVRHAILLAKEWGVELAVRSGGHSVMGHSTTEGGIVIDLRSMTALDVDVNARTAWAETGLTALAFTEAVAAHGLIVGFGDSGSVGVGGLTVGGGVGYLSRKHGLTIDSILAAEVVTADGRVLHTDADEHSDLFWAIRGGGGNFGVVTRVKFQLHELPQFTGGLLVLPATPDIIAGFVAAAVAAPNELSTIANVMPAPPMPTLPAAMHGKLVVFAMLAYAGDDKPAKAAIAPFRALATPLADMVKPMPHAGMYPPEDRSMHPTAVSRTMFVDTIDLAAAETIMRHLRSSDAAMRVAQLRVLGGAVARVPADATAYAFRSNVMIVNVAAFYDGDEERGTRMSWVREFAKALQPEEAGAYVNFLSDDGRARMRAAYPGATWDRLTSVKATYDPANVFHRNHNIPPAAR
ncbi:MAG: FAD-binding oxidoreductase [Ilumatobacteraceae bacterium]